MRTVATPLSDHIAAGQFVYGADLYTFTLVNGTVIRWTGADVAITTGGNTFAAGPIITRGRMKWRMGLQTDELTLTITPRAGSVDNVNGVSLYQSISRGDFSGAAFKLERMFRATPTGSALDVVTRFTGRINGSMDKSIVIDAGGAQLTVQSMLYLLDKPFPANTYQPQCTNVLFDGMCQANPATFGFSGSITGVTSQSVLQTSFATTTVDNHRLGRFRFLTGANANIERMVKTNNGTGLFTFAQPWPAPVANGDTFIAYYGCDKKQSTCSGKFSNLIHFRGQPFIPLPETTT